MSESQHKKLPEQAAELTIVMVQDRFQVGDISGNADKIIKSAQQAHRDGADLVVFPELALVGYPPEDLLYRPGFLSLCQSECQRIVKALPDIDVVFGLPLAPDTIDKAGNGSAHPHRPTVLYNAAVWVRQGRIIATYYKRSLPNYSVFDELRYFTAGNEAVTVSLNGVSIGLSICEDVWQPEIIADYANDSHSHHKSDLLLVLNASPFHINKFNERIQVLQQRVSEIAMPVLYVNMIGGQDELVFDGESMVVNRQQQLLALAPSFQAAQITLEYKSGDVFCCHEDSALSVNEKALSASDSSAMIYQALVMGVKDFVHRNGFSGVVIGLSGGVDSALTLAIAVDALGADNVHAIMMPSRYTADISQQDAKKQAEIMGVEYDIITIESVFKTFLSSLAPVFKGAEVDVTEENLQARCRGVLLMAVSNKSGRMVLTTGNKSEMAVGYATLYGDMCGGFAPLKDVCKTRVYALCRYRNSIEQVIPERVITRPPTAELREHQLDQDSLPDYDILDRILELSVEQDVPAEQIIQQGFERDTVMKVIAMVRRNEYKRRQSAPGIRITRRAFGRDRRYPITSGYCC